jgi:hypothetical protein
MELTMEIISSCDSSIFFRTIISIKWSFGLKLNIDTCNEFHASNSKAVG